MTIDMPGRDDRVGVLAACLPGAAAVLRDAGISLCCGADLALDEAANRQGGDPDALRARLKAAAEELAATAPAASSELIDHIVTRYHDRHRADLATLVPLAAKVEAVHADDPKAPRGLAALLATMAADMETHMAKEEQILFPMMRAGGTPMIVHPIAQMRAEHAGHAGQLRGLEHIVHGFRLPDHACRSWRSLYAGTSAFAADLVTHMYLENVVLFPRFEGGAA